MTICESATRFDENSYYKTTVNEETEEALIIGEMNGEPVEFTLGDFSTAMVTVINNTSHDGNIKGAFTLEAVGGFPACVFYNTYIQPNETKSDNLVLYKGGAGIEIQANVQSISGKIESMGDHMYLVTGDCTITIS